MLNAKTSIAATVATVGTTTDSAVMLGRVYLKAVREHGEAYAAWTDDDDADQRERFEASGDTMHRAMVALSDALIATGRNRTEVDGYLLIQPRGCSNDPNLMYTDLLDETILIVRLDG